MNMFETADIIIIIIFITATLLQYNTFIYHSFVKSALHRSIKTSADIKMHIK